MPQEWEVPTDSPVSLASTLELPWLLAGRRVQWQVQLRPSPFNPDQKTL